MKQAFFACGLVALLSACGGGGGNSAPAPAQTVDVFPVEATFSAFFSRSSTYTLSAKDSANNIYTLTYQITPGPDKTLAGSSATASLKTFVATATVSVNAGAATTSSAEIYYSIAPFKIWGMNGGNFEHGSHFLQAAPATATVGTFGVLASGTITNADGLLLDPYSRSFNWSLERDTAATAWLCLTSAASTTPPSSEKDCAKINATGVVTGFKTTILANNTVLEFR